MAPKRGGLGTSSTTTNSRPIKRERGPLYPTTFIQSSKPLNTQSPKKSPNSSNTNSNLKGKAKQNTPTANVRPSFSKNSIDLDNPDMVFHLHSDKSSIYSQSMLGDNSSRKSSSPKRRSMTSTKNINSAKSGQITSNVSKTKRTDNNSFQSFSIYGDVNKTVTRQTKQTRYQDKTSNVIQKNRSNKILIDANVPVEIDHSNSELCVPTSKTKPENKKYDEFDFIKNNFYSNQDQIDQDDQIQIVNDINQTIENNQIKDKQTNQINSNVIKNREQTNKINSNEEVIKTDLNVKTAKIENNIQSNKINSNEQVNKTGNNEQSNQIDSNEQVNKIGNIDQNNKIDSNEQVNKTGNNEQSYQIDSDRKTIKIDNIEQSNKTNSNEQNNKIHMKDKTAKIGNNKNANQTNSNEQVNKIENTEQSNQIDSNKQTSKIDLKKNDKSSFDVTNRFIHNFEYENENICDLSPIKINDPKNLGEIEVQVDIDDEQQSIQQLNDVSTDIKLDNFVQFAIENQELFDQSPKSQISCKYIENPLIFSIAKPKRELTLSETKSVFDQSQKYQTSYGQHEKLKNKVQIDENSIYSSSFINHSNRFSLQSIEIFTYKEEVNKPLNLRISESLHICEFHSAKDKVRLAICNPEEISIVRNDSNIKSNKSMCLSALHYDYIDNSKSGNSANEKQVLMINKEKYTQIIKELEDEFSEASEILNNLSRMNLFNVEFPVFH